MTDVNQLAGEIQRKTEQHVIMVGPQGLCFHLYTSFSPVELPIDKEGNEPTAECGICMKKWKFSREERKFVEL